MSAAGAGQVILASHTPAGPATAAAGGSGQPHASADGAFVVFQSTAANLVAGQSDANGTTDVFLLERATGTVTLVSHTPASTTTANAVSYDPSMSADGAFVAFQSGATDLVAGQSDANARDDVFLFQRATGVVTLVSHVPASATTTADGATLGVAISADGAVVAFGSYATNQVASPSDANGFRDVFLFGRATGAVTLLSHIPASTTTTANGTSDIATVSADGAFVAFQSSATDLVSGQSDANAADDLFLFDRATGAVTLVSHTPASNTTTANGASSSAAVSADGAFVAFQSRATDLVPGQSDANATDDVFLFERATRAVMLVSHNRFGTTTTAMGFSGFPAISADGAFVAFRSTASDVVGPNDANGVNDVFLFQRATGAAVLVSHIPASTTTSANATSNLPAISADGGFVAFQSSATDLVTGQSDAQGTTDVFLFERATGSVTLVSHTPASATTTANGASCCAAISADGAIVAFESYASDLVAAQSDVNGFSDVFVFQRAAGRRPPADFDGDGKTDVSVFRPSTSSWYVHGSAGADTATNFGTTGDIPVPGDYDGNGTTDIAVFRPSTGTWIVRGGLSANFGTPGDIPVPGDYDGNGTTDIAVFRPSTDTWFVRGGITVGFGTTGDIPVPGDYDGNGTTDIAVFRPSTGTWYVQGGITVGFGTTGDIPVPGDYDGNATTDIAVFRSSTGTWFVRGGITVAWGGTTDIPVPGDYNGDGSTETAVFRPSTGVWFVRGGITVSWGSAGDVPLPLPDAIRRFYFTPL